MIVSEDDTVVGMRKRMVSALSAASDRNGKLVTDMNGQLTAFYNGQRPMMMAVTAAGVVLALLIAILITVLTITRPLTRLTGTMRKLAAGDLEIGRASYRQRECADV